MAPVKARRERCAATYSLHLPDQCQPLNRSTATPLPRARSPEEPETMLLTQPHHSCARGSRRGKCPGRAAGLTPLPRGRQPAEGALRLLSSP